MKSTREGFGDGLLDIAAKFPNVVTVDADLRHSVQTLNFAKKYPKRAYNVGIAEQNLIGVSAGLARGGKIPFCASFATFITGLGYNQIRQSVCYSENNVKVVGSHAGILTGEDGATHQALEDLSLMRGLPGMRVYCPADYYEARAMIPLIAKEKGPCYLRLGRQKTPTVYGEKFKAKLGKADVLRNGKEGIIFAIGTEVPFSLEAAEILKTKGKSLAVVNVSTLKPLDTKTILPLLKKFKKVFTAEDHSIIGGLGSAIAELIAESGLGNKLARIGMRDQFGESGKSEDLLQKYKLDGKGLAEQVLGKI
ncbi:transketolase family protein [Candidatus Gracilibacteria bacterium]|nr:transketolase family protein [Candidatus Gracilibacteria bacterium]MCF7856648.1 transketolase family protein [Candidatus Gracilibacteria bacterium]MCF7896965.1 transketolase family protein [Candidatus Gracilibacteria bacterium]